MNLTGTSSVYKGRVAQAWVGNDTMDETTELI
jgi:hypothetical protein